jgi:hypothetical protein
MDMDMDVSVSVGPRVTYVEGFVGRRDERTCGAVSCRVARAPARGQPSECQCAQCPINYGPYSIYSKRIIRHSGLTPRRALSIDDRDGSTHKLKTRADTYGRTRYTIVVHPLDRDRDSCPLMCASVRLRGRAVSPPTLSLSPHRTYPIKGPQNIHPSPSSVIESSSTRKISSISPGGDLREISGRGTCLGV